MKYISTRGSRSGISLSQALEHGLAPDGGLYVPEYWPKVDLSGYDTADELAGIAEQVLAPFFCDDKLEPELKSMCRSAFSFPVVLKDMGSGTFVLELFHGPTAAFKDFGARFLAECLSRLALAENRRFMLLVATSGDTGGAVAAAFHEKVGVDVAILYPRGMVSPRQEKQLTTWGGNVRAFAVEGTFDDCQRLVKEAIADPALRSAFHMTSANSINVGRLLPQMAYFAWATLEHQRRGSGVPLPSFIIPSGNLGNAVAALWARRIGVPVRDVVLSTNSNPAITSFTDGAPWSPRPTVATLATAMDVGSPSNMERVFHLFGGEAQARSALRAFKISDHEIKRVIAEAPQTWGQIWDPHTATSVAARERLDEDGWIVVATAHPAKFEMIVEPLINQPVPVPMELSLVLDRQSDAVLLEPRLDALATALRSVKSATC